MEEGLPEDFNLYSLIFGNSVFFPTSFEEQNTCSMLITPFAVYLEKIRNHLN